VIANHHPLALRQRRVTGLRVGFVHVPEHAQVYA